MRLNFRFLLALGIAAFTLLGYFLNTSTNPVTGEKQHVNMSAAQEISLGLQAAPAMAQEYGGESNDARATAAVQQVGQRLVQANGLDQKTQYRYQFHLLADDQTVNAFALPGGQVFITMGLLKNLTSEAQLAGVLAHEVGHVVGRHSAAQVAKSQLTQGLTGAAAIAAYDPDHPASGVARAAAAAMIAKLITLPLAAEPTHGVATPQMWIATTPFGLDVILILHVVWLALCVALWSRRAGASELGALTAGVLIATTGIVTSSLLRGALPALSDLPWIGLCASALAVAETRREAARWAAAIAVLIGLVGLSGQFGALLDAIALAIVLGASRNTTRWLALAVFAGAAIASAQWIAAFSLHAAGAEITGLSPARLVELVVPGSFGSPDPAHGLSAFATPTFPSLFVGAALLGLACVPRTASPRGRWLALGLALAAFVVGRGGWPAWFGAPEVQLATVILLVAVRGARGVDAFVAGEKRALVVLAIAAGVTAVITWCVVALADSGDAAQASAIKSVVWRSVSSGGIGLALIGGAIALAKLAPKLRFLALALLVAPSVGALAVTAPMLDRIETPKWAQLIEDQHSAAIEASARDAAAPRRLYRNVKLEKSGEPSTAEAIQTLARSAPARWDIASARTDDPARSPNDDAAWIASQHGGGELLERFGIGFAVLPASIIGEQHLNELDRRALWSLVRYPAAPAAVVVSDWQWIGDDAHALAALFPATGGRGIPASSVILHGQGAAANPATATHATTCDLVRWDPGAIDLACVAPNDGYAVISSSAAPGWSVEVDGTPRPWFAADVLRRAVAVPPGKHAVRWRYTAPSGGAARGLLLAGLALVALLVILSRRRS